MLTELKRRTPSLILPKRQSFLRPPFFRNRGKTLPKSMEHSNTSGTTTHGPSMYTLSMGQYNTWSIYVYFIYGKTKIKKSRIFRMTKNLIFFFFFIYKLEKKILTTLVIDSAILGFSECHPGIRCNVM